ncbi:hypothetical protein GWK47_051486 [Chionoecetes opilio]|uniref:Uncharacterized protein n=1 Tax=Chionoecetes opilio TaxID=41210 RepID=A0A8J4Y227_CHIOP|nr:hypothetical protein GWK47_051486 [Chionoecetes opilio]
MRGLLDMGVRPSSSTSEVAEAWGGRDWGCHQRHFALALGVPAIGSGSLASSSASGMAFGIFFVWLPDRRRREMMKHEDHEMLSLHHPLHVHEMIVHVPTGGLRNDLWRYTPRPISESILASIFTDTLSLMVTRYMSLGKMMTARGPRNGAVWWPSLVGVASFLPPSPAPPSCCSFPPGIHDPVGARAHPPPPHLFP